MSTGRGARDELRRLRETVWGDPGDGVGAATSDGTTVGEPSAGRARVGGLARFGVVGVSGIVVNEAAIAALVSGLGLHYVVGYLLATQFSTVWNFAFIETWAFRSASPTNRRWQRFLMLMVVNNIANVLSAPLFVLFTSTLGINYLVSNVVTLGIVFVARFAIAERIWGGAPGKRGPSDPSPTGTNAAADVVHLHARALVAARAAERRFATPAARRVLQAALVGEQDALQRLGYESFSQFLDDAQPRGRADPRPGELVELLDLRARVARLEAEQSQAPPVAAPTPPREAAPAAEPSLPSKERSREPAPAPRRATRAKWFPSPQPSDQ